MSTQQLQPSATHHGINTSWRQYFSPWLLAFVIVGFIASVFVVSVLTYSAHWGVVIAVVLVLVTPVSLLLGSFALRESFRKWALLKPKLRWWHALWFLLYLSTLVWRVRDQGAIQQNPLDAYAFLRIIPETVVFAWLTIRYTRRDEIFLWLRSLFGGVPLWLTIFALACLASTFWSVYAAWTLFKSLEYMLDLWVLAAVLSTVISLEDYRSLFRWTWTILAVELAWVWIQIPLWPADSFEDGRLKGFFPSTAYNYVGQSGAIFAILAVCRLLPAKGSERGNIPFTSVMFAGGVATLLACQTRNTIAAFGFAVLVVLVITKRKWMIVSGAIGGAMAFFFTPLGDVAMTYLQRDQSRQAMEDMTGRAELWSYAWQQFLVHPLTGMGAYAAGRFFIMTKIGKDTASLHSDWVELLVGVGLMGLIPFVIALFGTWWYLVKSVGDKSLTPAHRQMILEAVAVLAVITIHSIFNDELTWHAPLLFMVTLGCAELLRRRQKATIRIRSPLSVVAAKPFGGRVYSNN
jgi:O-antigen ligase